MLVSKAVTGVITISELIDGYLVTKKYIGHTVKEAKKLFNEEVKKPVN